MALTRHIALLRGINVGGNRIVPMAKLRTALEAGGFAGVRTYLQSGNVVLDTSTKSPALTARRIEQVIADTFGFDVQVLCRSVPDFDAVMSRSPYLGHAVENPKFTVVVFLDKPPGKSAIAAIDPSAFAPDEFIIDGDVVYAWYPNGQGRSKLTFDVWTRKHGLVVTARNWSTVTKLSELAHL